MYGVRPHPMIPHGLANFSMPVFPPAIYPAIFFGVIKQKPVKLKFTPEEDEKLKSLVQQHGTNSWALVARLMGNRNHRQCRERWKNYVNPELRVEPWTLEEDRTLVEKFEEFGPKWNKIAKFLPNRADNSIRNRWQLMLRQWERQNKPLPTFTPQLTDEEIKNNIDMSNESFYVKGNNSNYMSAPSLSILAASSSNNNLLESESSIKA